MIKKTFAIILVVIFVIFKKIFIKENRVPNKAMDTFSNTLHSLFIFTSFPLIYLVWFELKINGFSLNTILYIFLFFHILLIIRYFNPKMLIVKPLQVSLLTAIRKISLILFIINWIVFSFGFAVAVFGIIVINSIFYTFIINQLNRQKEQAEFKKQFGEGNYTTEDIVKKHIINLFEEEKNLNDLTRSDIKKQYRNMAKKYHPDVYKGDEKDKFSSINSSYNFLRDAIGQ